MTDFLSRVIADRRADVAAAKAWRPLDQVRRAAERAAIGRGTRRFADVIREQRRQGRLAVIAEVKRTSPALGRLAEIEDPGALARRYVRAGATAISVLVEPRHWGGSLDDLRAVRSMSAAILAKDVVVDEYQIAEAGAAGADAVLLIGEVLDEAQLARFIRFAGDLGMEALVEAHEPEAFGRAVRSGAALVGVNARDLREPSRLDRRRVHDLVSELVTDQLVVAESGITSVEDAEALPSRVDAILVGTALVRSPDPAPLIRALADVRPGRALA